MRNFCPNSGKGFKTQRILYLLPRTALRRNIARLVFGIRGDLELLLGS
jgi:hypothetical protein